MAATAPRRRPVTFSSAGACSNTGATFTMTSGTGTCSVKYDQAGNANYNAAPQVTETVTATKANQTIIVTPHAPATRGLQHELLGRGERRRLGERGHLLEQRRLLEHRRHLHDDERHRHLHGQVRPGRRRELQRSAAGHRDGHRAEGEPDDHGHAARAGSRRSSTRASRVAATGGGSGNAVTFSSSGACSNTGATFTMTSGTGTCSVTLRPGRRRQLQRRAAGDRERVGAGRRTRRSRSPRTRRRRPSSTRSFTVAATGGGSGNAVTFSSSGACSNTGATFTMTSGTRHLLGQVRPGRRRQLQRRLRR